MKKQIYTTSLPYQFFIALFLLAVFALAIYSSQTKGEKEYHWFMTIALGFVGYVLGLAAITAFRLRIIVDEQGVLLPFRKTMLWSDIKEIRYYKPRKSFYTAYQIVSYENKTQNKTIEFPSNLKHNGKFLSSDTLIGYIKQKHPELSETKGLTKSSTSKMFNHIAALALAFILMGITFPKAKKNKTIQSGHTVFFVGEKLKHGKVRNLYYELKPASARISKPFQKIKLIVSVSAKTRNDFTKFIPIGGLIKDTAELQVYAYAKDIAPQSVPGYTKFFVAGEAFCLNKNLKIIYQQKIKPEQTFNQCKIPARENVHYVVFARPGVLAQTGWLQKGRLPLPPEIMAITKQINMDQHKENDSY